ncbi:DNA-directed RNA polymerase subunit delta [Bacillus smithii]|uniref:DNA-directed RNA polymerase subunit delta n=1 Tax=Bacillus smithii TaxID=1479 RepID=UPI00065DCB9A|nr:DNA-directed RNA polymerase subunit delta [Bacillus smithii]AKP48852.1 DNA-directed RNA polymerase delta subunit [Bacillus smithii]
MNLEQLSKDELNEMSFIELAFAILENKKQAIPFQQLLNEIQKILELSDEEIQDKMVQFYTDLNIDGRFLALGENQWGLRAWYPIDQIEEETAPTVKVRKKKAKKAVEDELEDYDDTVEDGDFEDLDDFDDSLDEVEDLDDEEDFDDLDEEEDFDDDLLDEDYDLDEDELDEDLDTIDKEKEL